MELILLSLLGLGAVYGLTELFDDDNPDNCEADEDDRIEVGSWDTVNAGDGNDTIIAAEGEDAVLEGVLVNGEGGDDLIDLETVQTDPDAIQGQQTLSGGDGQDTIISIHSYGSSLSGDDGDDVLIGGGNATMLFGGNGNDDLTIHGPTNEEVNRASGGDGDDTLTSMAFLDQSLRSSSGLEGGEGNDLFVVSLQGISDPVTDPESPDFSVQPTLTYLVDFDPNEDQLVIDLQDLGPDDPALVDYEIEEDIAGNTYIILNFENGATGDIRLNNVVGVTSSQITVLT